MVVVIITSKIKTKNPYICSYICTLQLRFKSTIKIYFKNIKAKLKPILLTIKLSVKCTGEPLNVFQCGESNNETRRKSDDIIDRNR